MIDTAFFKKIGAELRRAGGRRTEVVALSTEVLHASKRAIFALHRFDSKGSEALLRAARATLMRLERVHGEKIDDEGAYRAALEEFVEAELLGQFVAGKKLGRISGVRISANIYFAGLCDFLGELARFALHAATRHDAQSVRRVSRSAEVILEALIVCDFTGYLRTKFDQAKGHYRRIEEIVYEYTLRAGIDS